ncbi:MAG: type II secretion system protein [Dehalococcoidia bacterium]|nr:type II secretion system protein [Dehalococcoidia bacterium]
MIKPNSQVRKAFQGSSRGFALVEIVIAIALLGVIAVAILGSLSYASTVLIISDERATAESLACSQMEYVKDNSMNPYDIHDPQSYEQDNVESTEYPGYFISVSAEPVRNPDDGIQKITVTVSRDGEVLVTLEDYKRNPEI